jgi:flagellar basal-body rod protein FlgC
MDFDHCLSAFRISSSGLAAERLRMKVIANNLANANVTRTPEGGPYRKDEVVFRAVLDRAMAPNDPAALGGVRVERVVKSTEPFRTEYRPGHPDADKTTGMVRLPNVNPVTEMVDLLTASRSYQANLAVLTTYKDMMHQTLRLGQ